MNVVVDVRDLQNADDVSDTATAAAATGETDASAQAKRHGGDLAPGLNPGLTHSGPTDAVGPTPADALLGLIRTPNSGNLSDGRVRRRHENRERVMTAMIELIKEGDSNPSVAAVADRAAVSHRSVFRYFDDLDDLIRSSVQFGAKQARGLSAIPNIGEGPLALRIDTFIDVQLRLYEATYELGRVARNQSDRIPELRGTLQLLYSIQRAQTQQQFAPELSRLDPADAELVTDGMLIVTGFGAYDTQRNVLCQSREHIRVIWRRALNALLQVDPALADGPTD